MKLFYSKNFRIFILVVLDILCVTVAALGALMLRFDMSLNSIGEIYLERMLRSLPVYFILTVAVMLLLKLYNRVWTYASTNELYAIINASIFIEVGIMAYHVFSGSNMPRSYYPLSWGIMTALFICVRFSKAFLKSMKGSGKRNITNRIMVIGAGSAATVLIRELRGRDSGSQIICAIDDNPNKKNKYIQGVPIVGTRHDIERKARKYGADEIIIAMPSADLNSLRDIIRLCQETKLPVRILPAVTKNLTMTSLYGELRPVSYEDLLGRDPVKVDQEGLEDFIRGKAVLITGGGGSIGSELCRQIVAYKPEKLIIFDIYENNAYDIQMELERHFPDVNISTLIGSVRDKGRLEAVFKKYRPDLVYHAAAHKHVPLMEKSPNEAIKNNCLGTLNAAELADKYDADNFVLISTDKAVRPTNIMGATKRICEMIVQTYAGKSNHTRFAAVRFGNVLGSNGSVIPLFQKQISEGGPVTVTHKEITRFFMTIPEAVALVLQSSLYAKGGEIFVLDMGKPVRIYELAENLIRLQGLRPGVDIKIQITGLRPGEKLYEEALMDEEGLDKTDNRMIYRGKPPKIDEKRFMSRLDALIRASFENGYHIKELTEEVCDTYTITDN